MVRMPKLISLVQTIRKRAILSYIGISSYGIGYAPDNECAIYNGYYSLPLDLQRRISCGAFVEIIDHLLLEKIIFRKYLYGQDAYPSDSIVFFHLTSIGNKILSQIIPELVDIRNNDLSNTPDGTVKLLSTLHLLPELFSEQ
jgi:hypothetical protein